MRSLEFADIDMAANRRSCSRMWGSPGGHLDVKRSTWCPARRANHQLKSCQASLSAAWVSVHCHAMVAPRYQTIADQRCVTDLDAAASRRQCVGRSLACCARDLTKFSMIIAKYKEHTAELYVWAITLYTSH